MVRYESKSLSTLSLSKVGKGEEGRQRRKVEVLQERREEKLRKSWEEGIIEVRCLIASGNRFEGVGDEEVVERSKSQK